MKPRLNAYLKQIQSGDFKTKKLCVIAILKESPKTLEYFRKNTNYSHQSLTSVLSVLCDEGMVRMSSSADNNFSIFSLVDSEENQIKLAKERFAEKKELFIARGLKQGFITYDENNKLVIS